jgi:tRNA pseudouridine38-40 synthase
MPKIALSLSYDGTAFNGWQTQPDGNTVQDHLEHAIEAVQGARAGTICAGRTDSGVHAFAQVVHFETNVERPDNAWVRGVNAHLPKTVAVHWAGAVSPEFNARMSAVSRTYRYLILESKTRQPHWENRAGWVFRPLDTDLMQQAANVYLGEHDFSSLRSSQCQAASPVRTLYQCELRREGAFIAIQVRGNAFLHHMVRNLVGNLVAVGTGKQTVQWASDVLESRDRRNAAPTFAAQGLYLVDVEYAQLFGVKAASAVASFPVDFD